MRFAALLRVFFVVAVTGAGDVASASPLWEKIQALGIRFDMVSAAANGTSRLPRLPLLRKGKLSFEGVSFDRSLIEILREVQKEEGKVLLDCNFFVQVAALISSDRHYNNGFVVTFANSLKFGSNLEGTGVKLGYAKPRSSEMLVFLNETHFLNKGQWVVQTGDDLYLGLVHGGMAEMTPAEWIETTKHGLAEEIGVDETKGCERILLGDDVSRLLMMHGMLRSAKTSRDFAEIFYESGLLNQWDFSIRHF